MFWCSLALAFGDTFLLLDWAISLLLVWAIVDDAMLLLLLDSAISFKKIKIK
jgi:hypothetical protein